MILLKVLLRAFVASAVTVTVTVLLNLTGFWIVAIIAAVILGFSGFFVGAGLLDDRANSSFFPAFLGFVILVAASLVSMGMIEGNLWPGTASGLLIEEAKAHPWATVFEFREGAVRTEWEGDAGIYGRYGSPIAYAYVVPVVGDGWTRDRPIAVWAVAQTGSYDERAKLWQLPARKGLRIEGFERDSYLDAVKQVRERYHLRADPDPVFIEWTPTPEKALEERQLFLGRAIAIPAISMFALTVLTRLFQ